MWLNHKTNFQDRKSKIEMLQDGMPKCLCHLGRGHWANLIEIFCGVVTNGKCVAKPAKICVVLDLDGCWTEWPFNILILYRENGIVISLCSTVAFHLCCHHSHMSYLCRMKSLIHRKLKVVDMIPPYPPCCTGRRKQH